MEADKGGEELDLPQSEEQPEFLSNDQAEAENGGVNENVADKHGDGENESGLSNVDGALRIKFVYLASLLLDSFQRNVLKSNLSQSIVTEHLLSRNG